MLDTIDQFTAEKLGLSKLPENLPTAVISCLVFTFIHRVVAPFVSKFVAPVSYGALKSKKARNTWGIHFTSQCHVLVIVPLVLWCIKADGPDRSSHWEKAFGWDDRGGFVNAIACGYFLWDSLDAVMNTIDVGYVIHGLSCLMIYALSFKPFVPYFALRCLLWEASTFFLNNHWFLDKTNRTGSTLQLVNGVCLLVTFFSVRIIYGGSVSYNFFVTLWHVYKDVPLLYAALFSAANIVLQGLNWYWLTKMVGALRKRFKDNNAGLTNGTSSTGVGKGNDHRTRG
ncbi:hypothetical protein AX15_006242 [Amanita polypyramis BW_CC]|nr:hypothetical protein AX15_006242 [Amanita polypyramis BW_CC]